MNQKEININQDEVSYNELKLKFDELQIKYGELESDYNNYKFDRELNDDINGLVLEDNEVEILKYLKKEGNETYTALLAEFKKTKKEKLPIIVRPTGSINIPNDETKGFAYYLNKKGE